MVDLARESAKPREPASPTPLNEISGLIHEPKEFVASLSAEPQLAGLKLRDVNAGKISWEKEYSIEAQIIGESGKKAVPKTARVYCPACRADETIPLLADLQAAILLEGTTGFQKRIRNYLQDPHPTADDPCKHTRAVILEETEYSDYRLISLRTPPGYGDDLDPTDFRSIKAYAIGHLIPQSKMVRTRARVLVEPKDKDLVLLVTETNPIDDEISSFKLSEQDKLDFAKYYQQSGRLDDIDSFFIPRLVGQTLRKQLMYLVLHSPAWIRLPDGTRIRGLLRLLIVGDTKTFKSKSLQWVTDNLRIGEMCYAETSSRTGLLYNIDSEHRILIWGILPRNDLGLCLIAGFHHIHPDEMVQFREVFEFQRIKVARLVEAEAHCRTRIIADSNPRRSSMKEYVLACEAIVDLPFFKGTPDMTRWDLYYTVRSGDVDQKAIDQAKESALSIPSHIQRKHVLWAMSRRPENIKLGDEVLNHINEVTEEIVDQYASETLPIIHAGSKETIVRLTVALATCLHSVDASHENVVPKLEHVDAASSLLRALFDQNLELDQYVSEEKTKTSLTDSDLEGIIGRLNETDVVILKELRRGSLQSGVLAEKLTLDDSTVRRHAATLKAMEIVRASRGRAGGYELAPKGIRVIRKLMPAKDAFGGGVPVQSVIPRKNLTINEGIRAENAQFTDYRGTPPQTGGLEATPEGRGTFLNRESAQNPHNYACEICGKPGIPISRIGEDSVRAFCNDHLGQYKGDL